MAKKRVEPKPPTVEALDEAPQDQPDTAPPAEQADAPPAASPDSAGPAEPGPQITRAAVTLDLPLGPVDPAAYVGNRYHVDVQLDRPDQARAMRSLYNGLDRSGARLENGRRVASRGDVIRWLLEEITRNLTTQ